jgi:RNA polymerase sigma-70 factor, ECF subfamily
MDQNSIEFMQDLCRAQTDNSFLGELLESHRARLRNMINLQMNELVRGRVDPSDVIQEAFVDATKRLPEFIGNPAVPFYVWLRSLATQRLAHVHRYHLGTQARDAGREATPYYHPLPAATSAAIAARLVGSLTSPSSAAVAAEHSLLLKKAMDALEPIDREILVLRHFEELTNAEAAAVLGLRPTAASNRYVRALEKLRAALQDRPSHSSEFTP